MLSVSYFRLLNKSTTGRALNALVEHLKRASVPHLYFTVHSEKGHDSFLLEPELYTPHIQVMLRNATKALAAG